MAKWAKEGGAPLPGLNRREVLLTMPGWPTKWRIDKEKKRKNFQNEQRSTGYSRNGEWGVIIILFLKTRDPNAPKSNGGIKNMVGGRRREKMCIGQPPSRAMPSRQLFL